MKQWIYRILIFGLLGGGIWFSYLAYREHQPFAEAEVKQEALTGVVIQDDDPENPLNRKIDFETLQMINPEIVGWLYVPQIGVDMPVLKGGDNEAYLNLDFEGNYSPLGSVFTWHDADPRLTDPHISLFAHNMPSGQMFGNLKRFEDLEFQKENPIFYMYTPERSKELCVMDVRTCGKDDAIFQHDWKSGEDDDQQTITLVTCVSYDITPDRLAVTGKVVREKVIL